MAIDYSKPHICQIRVSDGGDNVAVVAENGELEKFQVLRTSGGRPPVADRKDKTTR